MEAIRFDESGSALFQSGSFSFRHDDPETGLFTIRSGALTMTALPAVPGEYPETMALKGKRRPHRSEDGQEVRLDTESEIPFGETPGIRREFLFREGTLGVRTDFVLRHSFAMKSIVAGGLKIENLLHLKITEQPEKSIRLTASKTIDFAALPEGSVLFDGPKCPLRIVFTGTDKKQTAFELGSSVWRWDLPQRLPGRARFLLRKEGSALLFHWTLFEFRAGSPEEEPPHGRNLRFVWGLRGETGKTEPDDTKFREVIDLESMNWPDAARVLGPDGKRRNVPCFASPKTLEILKREIRTRLADAGEGDVYLLLTPDDTFCCSAVHENRGKREVLAHWDHDVREEFAVWANRQLSRSGARLVMRVRPGTDEKPRKTGTARKKTARK